MATITASIERSLQNCSLNQPTRPRPGGVGWSSSSSSSSDESPETFINSNQINTKTNNSNRRVSTTAKKEEISSRQQESNVSSSDDNSTFVELNSHVSLPSHWEQCLDLKTGEIYYIDWRNGMRAKEDPRTTATGYNGDYYSEDDDDDDDDEDDEVENESNCYDSEGSSTELSPSWNNIKSMMKHHQKQELNPDSVLVVAGCKGCLMYYMVPKQVQDCPRCSGQLLHFAANNSP